MTAARIENRAQAAGGAPRRAPAPRGELRIEDLALEFATEHGPLAAVRDVQLEIAAGEFVCLLGPSGCGKSTLLHALAGFLQPARGRLLLDGEPIRGPGPERGVVFQQYSLFPWKSALRNVMFGPLMAGRSRGEAEREARELLELVGLAGAAERFPAALSGGMQQRVGLARALAARPAVLLMDEPFAALDAQTRALLQEKLLELWERFRTTVLFVTHDVDEALLLADRVLVMSAAPGRIIAELRSELERPRGEETRAQPRFAELRRHCLELVRRESRSAFEQQSRALAEQP